MNAPGGRPLPVSVVLLSLVLLLPGSILAQSDTLLSPSPNTVIRPASPATCKLLDDLSKRNLMDGLLFNLLWSCGRQGELKQIGFKPPASDDALEEAIEAADVQVNNSAGENGSSTTQSETSVAYNEVTGMYCAAFNDSWEYFGGGGGFTGFASSASGAAWVDHGAVGGNSFGDPSLAWRRADGYFYLATLDAGGGLAVWRSTNDCQSFVQVSTPSTNGDDKEILTVDNSTTSPYYGTLYLVWTDFGFAGTPIRASRSTDGGLTWSAPVALSAAGTVQGAWPAVAPDGTVYVAWLRYASFPSGNITIEVARSTNGGVSYGLVTSPLSNVVSPRDATASTVCGRPALRGNLRLLASPQIAVDGAGTLHVVYSQDPDGYNTGDVINVYYRRSTNSGITWSAPIQLNDVGSQDQYFPTVQARGTTIVASWYDRRLDPGNLRQDTYKRVSTDGGLTWGLNIRVSDVSAPIQLDPNLATCYHGDYDQAVVTPTGHLILWADDRNFVGTRNDPDVWSDLTTTNRKGMAWLKTSHNATYGADLVGCNGCDPYVGDTSCAASLPILCIKPDGAPNPGLPTDFYNGWIGGNIGLTPPYQGFALSSLANANALCASFFGPGWVMAEF
ncbi:MAG TPA: sialidase family protein, partial [Thermoanaerobaculia bacterium]|nr:sialidase family protein [Thermoanaerobaculia bacterium]